MKELTNKILNEMIKLRKKGISKQNIEMQIKKLDKDVSVKLFLFYGLDAAEKTLGAI